MYADVVVLTYQSPDIDSYTYKIPKNLEKQIKIGQLVEVPFGKRNPMGVVLSIVNRPSTVAENIKPINKIVFSAPLLLPYQIELLKWMSAYYVAPMVNCLEAMLPWARLSTIVNRLSQNPSFISAIVDKRSAIDQKIILVPSINRIPETLAQFKNAKNYVIYHNELKPAEKFTTFARILDGNVDYIFGSRSAIFAPCPNLKKIIIHSEHDEVYKDERSPYFDTITIAEKIAVLTKAEIEIVDMSPRITTYFNFQKNIKINAQKTNFRIISLEKERLGGNYSPVALETEQYLKRVAKSKKNALLFLNKKTESGHIFCKSCKEKTFVETQPDTCPNCKSADIFFNSLNIYSLSQIVKKIARPYPVNIIEQKGETYPSQNSIEITTSFVFYSQPLKKYELVIFTLADSITQIADFSSEEKLYATAANLKSLLSPKGLLVIQTYNPQSAIIISAAKGEYKSFYDEQVDDRKLLSYPPFALLTKLTIRDAKKDIAEEKAKRLAESLNPLTINHLPITILGPYKPIYFAKYPAYSIIIKYKLGSYSLVERERAIENLRPLLKNLKNVQITVEPESLN